MNTKMFWVGYSWRLDPNTNLLSIEVRYDSKNQESYNFYWSSEQKAVTPPPLGVIETVGIAGLSGYMTDGHSKIVADGSEWSDQIKYIESNFERILSDSLLNVIVNIIEKNNENGQKLMITIQGPALSKLIGRLCYRRIQELENVSIYFMTFRRHFLNPNPFSKNKQIRTSGSKSGLFYGPEPSVHEAAISRRFYLLPDLPYIEKNKREDNEQKENRNMYPLMIESIEKPLDVKMQENVNITFLSDYLKEIKIETDYYSIMDEEFWVEFPEGKDYHKVLIPKDLLEVNNKSREKIDEDAGKTGIKKLDAEKVIRGIFSKAREKIIDPKVNVFVPYVKLITARSEKIGNSSLETSIKEIDQSEEDFVKSLIDNGLL